MSKIRWKFGYACECMTKVLPLAEEEFILRGLVKSSIDYFQLAYNSSVSASAGTHGGGGAFDTAQFSDEHLHYWRLWGCEVQHRTPAQGFDHHGHGVLKGCPHVSRGRSGAEWQLSEWERGRNGLRGQGPITGPGPRGSNTPTWKQALKTRGPVVMALKDDIAAEVVTRMRKEYDNIAAASAAAVLNRDTIENTFTGNPDNKTVNPATALAYLGRRGAALQGDNADIRRLLTEILTRLPKET